MKPTQLEKYRNQLSDLKTRLDSEVEVISQEIESGGLPVGEHDAHQREAQDAKIAIGSNERAIQQEVRAALLRIETGTFGTCADCGKKISKERLDALPYTPCCVSCESKREAT
jgi:RNA polymerase-binding transcription factor DksA